jgi:superfamily II DNA or RNA helicase
VTGDVPVGAGAHAAEHEMMRRQLDDQARGLEELRHEIAQLRAQLSVAGYGSVPEPRPAPVAITAADPSASASHPVAKARAEYADQHSSSQVKLAVYRQLFVGRDDVYARRWENRSKGTTGWSPAHAGDWSTPREQRRYTPLTDEVLTAHLEGRETIGLYPLLTDDTCRLLACDFDGTSWHLDSLAYVEAAEMAGVPTAVELSRSGNGAHVWTFFTARVPAADARAMGASLLREAMTLRGELDLDSYDRFFPSQDRLPDRGFGNLIALPLQGECRRERNTTVFVDPRTLQPWPDQFAFLSSVGRITPAYVRRTVEKLHPVNVGPETRLHRSSVRPDPPPPSTIPARLGAMLAICRAGIPPGLYATLKHLATLHNPEFHKNENLRLSNHATPRFIRCFVEDLEHLYLPRGLTERAVGLIEDAGSRLVIVDERAEPADMEVTFRGALRDAQLPAVDVMSRHDLGILEAPPGTGKTVMACALIAHHRTPTLVLVDRKPLLEQWRDRLRTHLDIEAGQIGAGKKRPTKAVDIAMIQTVTRSEQPGELLDGYGLVVVDECHHVPAPTVERALRQIEARRWLGLTATPQRSDGLKQIMIMQCGPIRHRLRQRTDNLDRRMHVHRTDLVIDDATDGITRGEVLALCNAALLEDQARAEQVCHDVASAMSAGRNCLVLSGRTEHVEVLADGLRGHGLTPLVLHGGLKPKQRRDVHDRLTEDDQVLLVATDRYIGEGFDCPRLDTLFLTFPISSPQRITQYVGRILREHPGKDAVEVHDYLDADVPMFAAMYRRRLPGYKQLGFAPDRPAAASSPQLPLQRLGASRTTADPQPVAEDAKPAAADVRAWAQATGLDVADRGRLSAEVRQKYRDAHR